MKKEQSPLPLSWGVGSSASRDIRQLEAPHERYVSAYVGNMEVLCLPVLDQPGRESSRALIERNSIALLSSYLFQSPDMATPGWLGHYSNRERVRRSGLWNSNHVAEVYDPDFLTLFQDLIYRR